MKSLFCFLLLLFTTEIFSRANNENRFFDAADSRIVYTGRIDFSNPSIPRFWQPGVLVEAKFIGKSCSVILQDEELWGKNHNYIEVVVDGFAKRIQTKSKRDTIPVADNLSDGEHHVIICKNTEANIGYLEFVGIICQRLVDLPAKPIRKIEFFGNSITCGTGADETTVACGKGEWHDQHNAWLSYGAITARSLQAQFHLSAVSGIGLMRSCCNMDITMPQVYDKISMRNDTILWDFNKYQPDIVSICLGQNDGIQDSVLFIKDYVAFIKKLRVHYPSAQIVCLSSPMADERLKAFMNQTLAQIVKAMHRSGDSKVGFYIFSKQYSSGCDYHPNLKEHEQIAEELTAYIKTIMPW